ncbi:MAG: hypothetical protein WEA77_06025, partial [Hyphomonas sp.]
MHRTLTFAVIAAVCAACAATSDPVLASTGEATPATLLANEAFSARLPWDDVSETALASRGFIAALDDPKIKAADGRV